MDDTAHCGRSSESANRIVTEINSINLEHCIHWSDALLTTYSTSICDVFEEALWQVERQQKAWVLPSVLLSCWGREHTGM